MLIGREREKDILLNALTDEYSQFIAVYGRRRVGKTFLIREAFNYTFTFQYTGAANTTSRRQLARFRMALKEQGLTDATPCNNWMEAFGELRRFITRQPEGKKVIFLDELPWMDAPRSGFLPELEAFWNGWASSRKDIVLIVCGSATSWMVKKIVQNKGGLHNRLTHRIALKPFGLKQCEQLTQARGLVLSRQQVLEGYMIFGGVPYYWTLLQQGVSLTQEVDRLIFSDDGELHDEFNMLYASLFRSPEPYIKIIGLLAEKQCGMTRQELATRGKLENNGKLTDLLKDLEWCGFIRSYTSFGKTHNTRIFQLIDAFTLFYYTFMRDHRAAQNYWQMTQGKPTYKTWCGFAFERVCLWHIDAIKHKLGISGILSNEYAWRIQQDKVAGRHGAQIDLLIDRSDQVIDLCEIKYAQSKYVITDQYAQELIQKRDVFLQVTHTRKALHLIMITHQGVAHNAHAGMIQNEIVLDDLFD